MDGKALTLAVALVCLVTAVVFGGTTGQLGGTVFDESGLPMKGVSVTAGSPSQIGADQTVTTASDGRFRFPRLAPGFYSVAVEQVGYAPQQLEQVQVRLERSTEVKVTLKPTSFAGQVEVVEMTPVVDPAQVSTGQTFSSKYITETGTNWPSLIQQTAGTDPTSFRRMLGSTPQDNTYQLDGFDATNWYQRFPNPAAYSLPFDAVQEVAVHSAGFEAEYGQASGGVVSVMTKSGGNLFSGTVDLRFTDDRLETSGEHYDPNEQESEDARFAATLGGPIVKDRLWFFASYGREEIKTTPTGAPTTEDELSENFLGKLSWQPIPSWSLVGKLASSPEVADNFNSSQFRAAEAMADLTNDSGMSSLEAVGVLSDATLLGLRLGYKWWDQTALPSDGDFETISHRNLVTGEEYGNYIQQYRTVSDQSEIAGDLTWFLGGSTGSHELKAGLSYGEATEKPESCLNGGGRCAEGVEGFSFRDVIDGSGNILPYAMGVANGEGPLPFSGQFTAAYLQDAWLVRSGLTLKLGLRWDHTTYENNVGEQIADLSKLQPRVGIAWDITGAGRSVLRASWGRFMHPGTLIMADLTVYEQFPNETWGSCSVALLPFFGISVGSAEECAEAAGFLGLGYRTDPEGWDPLGWWLLPAYVTHTVPSQTDPNLRPGYTDQWIIGFEQELFRRSSLELSYVNKKGRSFFDDTCNGNVPEPDPDGACDYWYITNIPDIRSDYDAWMLRFESSALDWLYVLGSWVVSSSKGALDYNTSATPDFDFYPYHYVNRYGYRSDQSRHRVKLDGYVLLPHDFSAAITGWWNSEFRWTPYADLVDGRFSNVFLEPRGNRQGEGLHQLDLQFSKGFRVGITRLVVLATIINATNSQAGDAICGRVTGCGGYDFGEAIEWQQPRRYELGVRVEF